MAFPAVVELARAAVRRLADAAPTADVALDALALIERVGLGPPYTVAIAGELSARSALLDCLAGQHLFDPARRDPDRIVMTLRRGTTSALRVRRRDGSGEEVAFDPARASSPRVQATPPPAPHAAPAAERAAPASDGEPTRLIRRPPWWAVWRWVAWWFRAWRSRLRPGLPLPSAHPSPLAPPAEPPAPPRRAIARTVERPRRGSDLRQHAVDRLRTWFADDAVERVFVELADGPLSEQVVVIELPSRADARSLDAVVADACLVACGDHAFVMTRQLETVLTLVPHLFAVGAPALPAGFHGTVRRIASFEAAAASLARLATIERALAVGRRAVAVLAAGSAALERVVAGAETAFRVRIDHLEALRIADPDDHTATALARVRQTVVEHAHRLIRRALDQLDDAIARYGDQWSARLRDAASTEALRAAAAQLDDESPAALQAAQATVQRALVDDLTEHARAHYRDLVGDLRRGSAAVPPWLTVEVPLGDMTSGTKLGAVAPRLSSLFRSVDALKADALAQLEQRIAKLRQVATANLRDAEPRLEPAVTGALAVALRAEVERHGAWLEAELARERLAIDAERAQIALLAIARDTARTDLRELTTALDALDAELP